MPGTPTQRFTVGNLDQWGRLVKSWATELDYISQDFARQPPRDYLVNATWAGNAVGNPQPVTVTDKDQNDHRKPWCLPEMKDVSVTMGGDPSAGSVKVRGIAMTAGAFRKIVGEAGVAITVMPKEYDHVVVVQAPDDNKVMILRLPPKKTLGSSEDDLLFSGNDYPFAAFYSQIYRGAPHPPQYADKAGIMQLHANRIGEYTLNTCS